MISRIKLKGTSLEAVLPNYDFYQVQSEAWDLTYGVDKNKFALLTNNEARFCPLHEVPKMAQQIVVKAVREELMEVYEDVMQRRNKMEVMQ